MNEKRDPIGGGSEGKLEQMTQLEEARAESLKAEAKLRKQEARDDARQALGEEAANVSKTIPAKVKIAIGIVIVAAAIVIAGFVVPYFLNQHENEYFAESDLKAAVDIDNLSAVDYAYHGIAEKHKQRFGAFGDDLVSYRVKYMAHVRASYKLSDIEFAIDNDNKVVTAYLPKATIGEPQLDQNEFGYLPSNTKADIKDVIALCREDAANDVDKKEIQKEADASLQNTVTALTLPMLGDSYTLEFKPMSEWKKEDANND